MPLGAAAGIVGGLVGAMAGASLYGSGRRRNYYGCDGYYYWHDPWDNGRYRYWHGGDYGFHHHHHLRRTRPAGRKSRLVFVVVLSRS